MYCNIQKSLIFAYLNRPWDGPNESEVLCNLDDYFYLAEASILLMLY